MTDKFISDVTLEYMMNKQQYAKHIVEHSTILKKETSSRKDKKFYRRRIIDLTKRLLNNEKPETMFPDVTSAFEYYSKICVEYFKVLDKTDIIQEDYTDLSSNSVNEIKNDFLSESSIDADNLMMRSIKIQEPNALEKLVKRKSTKMKKQTILPLQKNINLKDPNLKNKGICKKNNIDNKYEQITQKTYEKNDEKIPTP
uniref:Uncharacterized protein n=1 Tax=viral metagenome TaxID=1070528 RepID=A0A6C0DAF6_9ZZZZ